MVLPLSSYLEVGQISIRQALMGECIGAAASSLASASPPTGASLRAEFLRRDGRGNRAAAVGECLVCRRQGLNLHGPKPPGF